MVQQGRRKREGGGTFPSFPRLVRIIKFLDRKDNLWFQYNLVNLWFSDLDRICENIDWKNNKYWSPNSITTVTIIGKDIKTLSSWLFWTNREGNVCASEKGRHSMGKKECLQELVVWRAGPCSSNSEHLKRRATVYNARDNTKTSCWLPREGMKTNGQCRLKLSFPFYTWEV